MKRKSRPTSSYNYDREYDDYGVQENAPKRKAGKALSLFTATSLAILAGVFILGIGVGIGFYAVASAGTTGNKIDNTIQLESKLANPEVCVQFGAAAITMDTRVFVTLNPLNVYVSQPTTRPGCVLRTSNWSVLEQRGLLKSEQVRDCKNRLNTFGYTGSLDSNPQVDCVYQNDAAKNLFLQPGQNGGNIAPENERFK
jgi:hypothetical protein